ncbi:hypothetical protein BMT54_11065 [Pasteurellaceae bacterium 15-036681]|nr:hypothetical protein BMT54_11065 [Pasteurellaceae bacterium 15-036681]
MTNFTSEIFHKLEQFTPYCQQEVQIDSAYFSTKKGYVAQFVTEIKQTITLLTQQTESYYSEFYAHRLVNQFNDLQQAVNKQQNFAKQKAIFKSPYKFARNIHHLPKEKRLVEYKKVLRALNEKISWLVEQHYRCEDERKKHAYLGQIQETEYRRDKCLKAIEELE